MEYLNSKQVISAVDDYIKKAPYDYALMINGEWGSGKSYLVRNELIKHIEQIEITGNSEESDRVDRHKKYQTINISLYGVTDLNSLSNQISTSIMYRNKFWNTKVGESTKKVAPIVGAGLRLLADLKGTSISTDNDGFSNLFSGIAQDFLHLNEYVFIFDDLERSSIPVCEVFGFLSNLVESNSAKTIIVANESEIKDILANEEKNQKMLQLLSISEKINLPEIESNENTVKKVIRALSPNSNVKEDEKLDIETIKIIAEELFPSDENYKKFKEKIVGKTITYRPDLLKIIEPLMIKTFNKMEFSYEYSSYIVSELPSAIVHLFRAEHCYNLRTVQVLLNYMVHFLPNMIAAIREKFGNEDVHSLNQIVSNIGRVAIKCSKGVPYNKLDSVVQELDFSLSPKDNLSYKFAADYFYYGIVDTEYMNEAVEVITNCFWQAIDNPDNPLRKLSSFYLLTDTEALECYHDFGLEFRNGKYKFDQYPTIIRNMIDLYDVGLILKMEIESVVDQMCENVKGEMVPPYRYEFTVVPQAHQYTDYYIELLNKITAASKQSKNGTLSLLIQDSLETHRLNSQELKDFYSSKQVCNDQNSYFLIVDHEKLLTILKKAKSTQIMDFRHLISWIYYDIRLSEFEKSRESIEKFKCLLDAELADPEQKFFDKIAFRQARWLKGDLDRILDKTLHS